MKAFQGVDKLPDAGRSLAWPAPPPILVKAHKMLYNVQLRYWAYLKVQKISKDQRDAFEQKIVAYELFHGKRPWEYNLLKVSYLFP